MDTNKNIFAKILAVKFLSPWESQIKQDQVIHHKVFLTVDLPINE